jgi:hypothetical protein
MLSSKILQKKKLIDRFATKVTDLISSTFSFPKSTSGSGISVVNEYENMRPDLVANRIYGDQSKWDAILKYNGISNPFSIQQGDLLYAIPFAALNTVYIAPVTIPQRGERVETDVNGALLDDGNRGNKGKDKKRVENLANKNAQRARGAAAAKNGASGATVGKDGKLPPNLSKKGDKSVKIKDGRLVFGEDVTTVNKDNCPVPISRARLQAALLKDKLFL